MISLLIAFVVIVAILLIAVSLYMFKTRFVLNDRTYDALVWVINTMILVVPFLLVVCEACKLECTALIGTVATGLIALMEKIVVKSKANYKTAIEDGDINFEDIDYSENEEEYIDELTVIDDKK